MSASLLIACSLLVLGAQAPNAEASTQPAGAHSTRERILRLAVSSDGLAFEDVGPVTRGTAPDLIALPNGHLMLIFDQRLDGRTHGVGLAVTRSADRGRTWSSPRPARIVDAAGHAIRGRHGSLVATPDNQVRLYFTTDWKDSTSVLSAVTPNGLDYRIDSREPLVRTADFEPIARAARLDRQVCVWITRPAEARRQNAAPSNVEWFLSPDGRRFRKVKPVRVPSPGTIDALVALKEGVRAFVTTPDGVRSLVSTNGLDLEPEPGIRVPHASGAAVIRLNDGAYAMVYCTDGTRSKKERNDDGEEAFLAGGGNLAPIAAAAEIWEPFDASTNRSTSDADADAVDPMGPPQTGDDAEYVEELFAPMPDFIAPFDYVDWFRQQLPVDVPDDASPAYGAFMPDWFERGGGDPAWPDEIDDMLNGHHRGPIGAWDPLDHPNWEATHEMIQPLLDQFRLASRYENCSAPLWFPEPPSDDSDHLPMLMDVLLPSLAKHRAMVKATLADAWRLDGDRVPPDRMIDALETCLRAAGHMDQAPTLIHRLVGTAERGLAHAFARQALAEGVIPEDRIEEAFQRLVAADREPPDPGAWIRFEHAAAMEILQHIYPATDADGHAELDADLVIRIFSGDGWHGDNRDFSDNDGNGVSPEMQEKLDRLRTEDPRAAAEGLDAHFRDLAELWSIGPPEVNAGDIAAIEQQAHDDSTIGSLLVPSLSRAYEISMRCEASRRATQLSYALHIFKQRHNRWPNSLDELPPEMGRTMRTDPYSGANFAYRLTPDGPVLYSTSRNGLDDGGIHSRHWGEDSPEGASDDYVFWPPHD